MLVFDSLTRPSSSTFGFEPNPAHRPALERLQRRYRRGCGWNVTFHTETAVSNRGGGEADFFAVDVKGLGLPTQMHAELFTN